MKNFLLILFSFACFNLFSQGDSPATALPIDPSGTQLHALIKGKGIWCSEFMKWKDPFKNDTVKYSLCSGFVYWCHFQIKDTSDLTFIIQSLDQSRDVFGLRMVDYLDFMLYQFDGDGPALQNAILNKKITPCRIGDSFFMAGNYHLDGSGLVFYSDDTVSMGKYASGYLKPVKAKPGTQYYLLVQILCSPTAPFCDLNCDNRFSLCFDNSCVPAHIDLGGIPISKNKVDIKSQEKTLDGVAAMLKNDSTLLMGIYGYTDKTNDSTKDSVASAVRAKAVYDYMVSKGVNRKQLYSKAEGAKEPMATNDTEENRMLNRRVRLQFSRKGKSK